MYAIIETGGKQYRVELGSEIEVERLAAEPGSEIVLERVLLVADGDSAAIGQPLVGGAEVRASVLRQDRGEKIVVFKYGPKTRRRVKRGHRQELTVLRVADIVHDGKSAAEEAASAARESGAEREKAEAAAADQAARDAALAAELARKAAAAKAAQVEDAEKARPKRGARRKPVPPTEDTKAKRATEPKGSTTEKPAGAAGAAGARERGRRTAKSSETKLPETKDNGKPRRKRGTKGT